MPRYANSGEAVNAWYEQWNQGSSTFDLCRPCGKRHDEQPLPKALEPYQAHEPRGALWEMESPLWEDYDFEGYRCNLCDVTLTPRNY